MIFLHPFIDNSLSILFDCNKDSVSMVTAAVDIIKLAALFNREELFAPSQSEFSSQDSSW
jgi:hypothetical protein